MDACIGEVGPTCSQLCFTIVVFCFTIYWSASCNARSFSAQDGGKGNGKGTIAAATDMEPLE